MSDVKSWESVCDASDLVENLGVRALLGEQQVAIFKVQNSLYAVEAIDPFTNAAVMARGIIGSVKDEIVVASPIYKQHFSLATGACLEDDAVSLKTFPVREEGGQVQLGLN